MFLNKANVLYRPHKMGFKKFLGDLEADVMEVVWEKGSVTVRDVYDCMLEQRKIAYTTVMSTMSNLAKKELLHQEKSDLAYVYTPKYTKNELSAKMVGEVINGLIDGFSAPLLANIAKLPNTNEIKNSLSDIGKMLDGYDKSKQERGKDE